MTGAKNIKSPVKNVIANSFPKALREKLGEELTFKLCTRSNYRERKHIKKCPECGKKKLRYRSLTHDLRCSNPKCKAIVSITKKTPVGYVAPVSDGYLIDPWLERKMIVGGFDGSELY